MTWSSEERKAALSIGETHYFTGIPCMRGHLSKRLAINSRCVECHRIMGGQWLRDNPEKTSEASAKWRVQNVDKRRVLKSKWDEKNKDRIYARNAEWQRNHPIEHSAHNKVYRAKKAGRLKPMPCERCSSNDAHAHHEDYLKPMDIKWLCPSCHVTRHWEIRRQEGGQNG